jgi:glycosyltransferase involved in cell wall biosynthesis
MRLLIVTQVVDSEDAYLGFFHRWLEEFSTKFERIETVCLQEGKHALPANVRVHSLGKEKGKKSSLVYAVRFIVLAWKLRNEYDAVFVHMNEEYVLVGGWLFEILGKPLYLWRNHYAGSWKTSLAATFCRKVFYTSIHSYTARFERAVRMPVGVDTTRFYPDSHIERKQNSILFLARMMESKRPGLLIDALIILAKRGVAFTASFVGSAPSGDEQYIPALRQRVADAGLNDRVTFYPGVSNDKVVDIFRAHQIFVNAGRSGMFDKTLFEASASGCHVIAASDDWKELAGGDGWFDGSASMLAETLERLLSETRDLERIQTVTMRHSLTQLAERLQEEV